MAMNKYDTNIKTVNVNRSQLLTTLESNLKTHKEVFREAMKGYQDAKITKMIALHGAAEKAVNSNNEENRKAVHEAYSTYANLRRPQDHSESYELAIEIMKWETEDTIELSINDFQCYVRDKWNWKEQFRGSVTAYANDHSHRI